MSMELNVQGSSYHLLNILGQGTYGVVHSAQDNITGQIVALKIFKDEPGTPGLHYTSVREIQSLERLKHLNIVNLIKYHSYRSTGILVLEFCDCDLAALIADENVQLHRDDIMSLMGQFLSGLAFMHGNSFMHRDLKPENVLMTWDGIVKLADFGGVREMHNVVPKNYTNKTGSRWQLSPEQLLGDTNYGPGTDVWSAGCIMIELFLRDNLMRGNSEQHQLNLISHFCGSINPEIWPGVQMLPLYYRMLLPQGETRKLKNAIRVNVLDENALDLIDQMMSLDPRQRPTALDAFLHISRSYRISKLEHVMQQHLQNKYNATPQRAIQGYPLAIGPLLSQPAFQGQQPLRARFPVSQPQGTQPRMQQQQHRYMQSFAARPSHQMQNIMYNTRPQVYSLPYNQPQLNKQNQLTMQNVHQQQPRFVRPALLPTPSHQLDEHLQPTHQQIPPHQLRRLRMVAQQPPRQPNVLQQGQLDGYQPLLPTPTRHQQPKRVNRRARANVGQENLASQHQQHQQHQQPAFRPFLQAQIQSQSTQAYQPIQAPQTLDPSPEVCIIDPPESQNVERRLVEGRRLATRRARAEDITPSMDNSGYARKRARKG